MKNSNPSTAIVIDPETGFEIDLCLDDEGNEDKSLDKLLRTTSSYLTLKEKGRPVVAPLPKHKKKRKQKNRGGKSSVVLCDTSDSDVELGDGTYGNSSVDSISTSALEHNSVGSIRTEFGEPSTAGFSKLPKLKKKEKNYSQPKRGNEGVDPFPSVLTQQVSHGSGGDSVFAVPKKRSGAKTSNSVLSGSTISTSSSRGIGGGSSMSSSLFAELPRPQAHHYEEAHRLAEDEALFRRAVRSGIFERARVRAGVELSQLLPRQLTDFSLQPGRAFHVRPDQVTARFQDFQQQRMEALAQVILEQEQDEAAKDLQLEELVKTQRLLKTALESAQSFEARRRIRLSAARAKQELVLRRENDWLIRRRHKLVEEEEMQEQLQLEVAAEKEEGRAAAAAAAKRRQDNIARHMDESIRREASRVSTIKKTMAVRQAHVVKVQAARGEVAARNAVAEKTRRDRLRTKVKKEKEQRMAEQREYQMEMISEKERRVVRQQQRVDAEQKAQMELSSLKRQRLRVSVARMRRVQEEKRQLLLNNLQEWDRRVGKMHDVSAALVEERRREAKRDILLRAEASATQRLSSVTPGPGEYSVQPPRAPAGGIWPKGSQQSVLALEAARAAAIPAPTDYSPVLFSHSHQQGFGRYRPKTDLEWTIYHAAQRPGPGEYDVMGAEKRARRGGRGQQFGNSEAKSLLQIQCDRAARVPGPGAYGASINPPRQKPSFQSLHDEIF